MRLLFVAALLLQWGVLVLANPNIAHNGTKISGQIMSDDGIVPFASVIVTGTTIGTAANESGFFMLNGVPEGEQTIQISAIGYQTKKFTIKLTSGKEHSLSAHLAADRIGLEQVVVSASRAEKNRREAASIVSTISPKLLENAQCVSLSEGLNFTPGVRMENNCQNCGFAQVRLNGLEGPYSQILINSRPVFSGLAGVYGLELIPANMIDRVEVVRGGGSALYGSNAIAGTINLITKEPLKDFYTVQSSTGISSRSTTDFNLNLNGAIINDDYSSGFTFYGFKRNREPFDANGDGFSEISLIANNTYGASWFQRTGTRSKIKIDYFYIDESRRGGNKFELPNHEADISEAVDHQINSVNLNFDQLLRVQDKWSIFAAFQQVKRNSYYGANQDLSAYGATQDFSWSAGTQYNQEIGQLIFAPADLVWGTEFTHNSLKDSKLAYFDISSGLHLPGTLIANQSVTTVGMFAQNEWHTNRWRLSAGIRMEHYTIAEKETSGTGVAGNVASPRISILYNVQKGFQLRGSYAKGYRAPQIFDEDLHYETSGVRKVVHQNDPNLKQETSHSMLLSADYSQTFDRWQFQFLAESFFTHLKNPFTNLYGTPNSNGEVVYTRTNAEEGASVKGVNFELNASPGSRLVFQSGFTVQQSRYEKPQEFDEKKFFRTPSTYGYLTLNYTPSLRLNTSLTANYTGRMLVPYFGNKLAQPGSGQLNKSGQFCDIAVRLAYDFALSSQLSLQLFGGAKNIFNAYQNDFDFGAGRDPGYIYGPMAPRTIYIGLKLGNIF